MEFDGLLSRTNELFESEFPGIADIRASWTAHEKAKIEARACVTRSRLVLRRAHSETMLRELLPTVLEKDSSYHVISGGDIDSLSYLAHVLRFTPLDHCLISTWCMAMPDVEALEQWLISGALKRLDLYVGEIFPSQYGDVYAKVKKLIANRDCGRVVVFRNHSKIIAGRNEAAGIYFASESSANVNTNPRAEQTTVHMIEDLYWFYRDYFDDIKSIA